MNETTRDEPRYTIGELADRADVSRRTVRYYVQRGLLPAPDGLGRGAHYSDAHVARLIRVRELQEAGIPLADITRALDADPGAPAPSAPPASTPAPAATPAPEAWLPTARWTRAVIGDGIELHVRDGVLGPEALTALVRLVTQHTALASLSVLSRVLSKEESDE